MYFVWFFLLSFIFLENKKIIKTSFFNDSFLKESLNKTKIDTNIKNSVLIFNTLNVSKKNFFIFKNFSIKNFFLKKNNTNTTLLYFYKNISNIGFNFYKSELKIRKENLKKKIFFYKNKIKVHYFKYFFKFVKKKKISNMYSHFKNTKKILLTKNFLFKFYTHKKTKLVYKNTEVFNFLNKSLNFFKNCNLIQFLRKNKIFNKSRYSRNRQIYKTGVYWCLWVNIIFVYGLYFYFYRFSFNFSYVWIFIFFFVSSFFFSRIIQYNYINLKKILNELVFFKNWINIFLKNIK